MWSRSFRKTSYTVNIFSEVGNMWKKMSIGFPMSDLFLYVARFVLARTSVRHVCALEWTEVKSDCMGGIQSNPGPTLLSCIVINTSLSAFIMAQVKLVFRGDAVMLGLTCLRCEYHDRHAWQQSELEICCRRNLDLVRGLCLWCSHFIISRPWWLFLFN